MYLDLDVMRMELVAAADTFHIFKKYPEIYGQCFSYQQTLLNFSYAKMEFIYNFLDPDTGPDNL